MAHVFLPSAHNARGAPYGEHGPPKSGDTVLGGHCGIGNVLPNIVKLLNIYRRLTRQNMRMDNLSLGGNVLAHLEKSRAPLASTWY